MTEFYELEKKIIQALKSANASSMEHAEVLTLQKKARTLTQKGVHEKAASAYGALATTFQNDLDLPLRAANSYLKAHVREDAARWFLQSAERYARQNYPTQAVATLRLYHTLKPDDSSGAKRIYKLCRDQGNDSETMLNFLSGKDRAGQRLLANDFFSIFDDKVFDALLDKMEYRHLKDREVLMHMGDVAKSLFFIIRGEVDGYLTFNNNRTHLGSIGEGGICGETAYFTGGRHTSEIVSKGEAELLELPYAVLDSLKEDFPALNNHLESLYNSRMLVKQLALTPVFEELDATIRQNIASKMTPVKIGAGQTLFKEGDSSLDLYLVRTGKVAIIIFANGSERMLKTVETGGIIGEIAIAAGGKRTATVLAVSDCTLMKLDAADFSDFYRQDPALQQIIHKRKQIHVVETLDMIKGVKMVEGDDTCRLLLKDIWQA